MTSEEVRSLLDAIVRKFDGDFSPPVEHRRLGNGEQSLLPPEPADWEALETRFGCRFPVSFKAFMEVAPDYNIPSVLNVRRDEPRTPSGDRRIDQAYDNEMSLGAWDPDLIPFLAVGNGDCFCLSAAGGATSAVFYFDHESDATDVIASSFDDWLANLEWHLNGT